MFSVITTPEVRCDHMCHDCKVYGMTEFSNRMKCTEEVMNVKRFIAPPIHVFTTPPSPSINH